MVLCGQTCRLLRTDLQPSLSGCHQLPSATNSATLRWLLLMVEHYTQHTRPQPGPDSRTTPRWLSWGGSILFPLMNASLLCMSAVFITLSMT